MALVYRYGCCHHKIPVQTRVAIREQLFLAHRYRVMLWHLAMAGRKHYRALRLEHFPELVEIEESVEKCKARLEETKTQALKDELKALSVRRKALIARAKESTAFAADVAEGQARQAELGRALRCVFSRTFGLYSGTYLHVEAAARSANAGTEDPVRPRWRGTQLDGAGMLAIQLQGGRTESQIMRSGGDPSLFIEPPERPGKGPRGRTNAHYRIRSGEKGAPVRVELPIQFSRPLPPDARIIWAKLCVHPVHEFRYEYSIQLTMDSPVESSRHRCQGSGVVAICLKDDVIAIEDEYGDRIEVQPFVEPKKLRDLQSIRDQMRNDMLHHLGLWCDKQDDTADWVREEVATIEERKSCRRLYHLRERLKGVVDPELERLLHAWAEREDHLYTWQRCFWTTVLRSRQDGFRVLARDLRKRYGKVVLDNRLLTSPARLTVEKRWLGLCDLKVTLKQAMGEDVVPALGDSCEELLQAFYAGKRHERELPKPKRTGFARKHEERKTGTSG